MKKKTKFRATISILCIILILSMSPGTAFAESGDRQNGGAENEPIPVSLENPKAFVSNDGETTITLDLVKPVPNADTEVNSTIYYKVGTAKFRVYWDSLRREFEGHWSVTLTNGEKIKKVTGVLNVREDWFGPYNPLITELKVNKVYKSGTLFANAEDVVINDYDGIKFKDLYYNTNIILEWKNFKVSSIENTYIVPNGNRQGKIYELNKY